MKRSEFWSLFVNPFTKIAGWQAFGAGFAIFALTICVGFAGKAYFDGIIDMHFVENAVLNEAVTVGLISLITLIAVMSIACVFLTKNFRFIDILGTITLAKAPYLILSIISLFVKMPPSGQILKDPLSLFTSVSFIIMSLISIPVIIWTISLMYNGLKVSSGIKGLRLNVVFVFAVIISEIISKILIYKLL